MQKDAARPGEVCNLCNGLDGADFTIGVHQGDPHGVRPQGRLHRFRINAPECIDRQHGDVPSVLFQPLEGLAHRGLFHGAGYQMTAAIPRGAGDATDGQVVGLGGATGKDDLT